MSGAQRAADPPMPADEVADAVADTVADAVAGLFTDDTHAVRVLVCRYGSTHTLLPTTAGRPSSMRGGDFQSYSACEPACEGLAGASPPTHTVLRLQNSRIPWAESSRP
jgi:hypothetical protein